MLNRKPPESLESIPKRICALFALPRISSLYLGVGFETPTLPVPVVLVFPLPSGVVHCAFTSTATHMNSARIKKLTVPATYSFTRDEEFISTISSVHRLNGFGQLQLSL